MFTFNKQDKEYKKLSHDIRVLANDIGNITGWSKEMIMIWLKMSNIKFKGRSPIEMFVDGKGRQVKNYVIECRLKGDNTI